MKWFYEAKPFVCALVGILAVLQIGNDSTLAEIAGYALIVLGVYIGLSRLKYRGYLGKKSADGSSEN